MTLHAAWLALDADPASRRARYTAWVSEAIDAVETEEIRVHLMQGKVYGQSAFSASHRWSGGAMRFVRLGDRVSSSVK